MLDAGDYGVLEGQSMSELVSMGASDDFEELRRMICKEPAEIQDHVLQLKVRPPTLSNITLFTHHYLSLCNGR